MTRTARKDDGKPQGVPAKTPASPDKPDQGTSGHDELEERIERLEKRLEETIDGIEGSAVVRTGVAIDDTERDDPLRRAVDRSNEKRDTEK